ncbi:MAG: hypothetical protein ABSA59_20655 [Terriglobia bacterium]
MAVVALLAGVPAAGPLVPFQVFGAMHFGSGRTDLLAAANSHVLGYLVATALVGQAPSAAPPDLNDRGTFEIFAAGKSIGTETFEIRVRADQIEAQGTLHLQAEQDGKKIEVRTSSNLLLDPHFDPLSYTWNQKGAQSSQLNIDFRTQPVQALYKTVSGQDDRRDFKLDQDVIVLDDNVIHHYQLAVARYDQAKGGTQAFRAFIPQEAAPGVITLKSVGPEPVTVDGDKRTLRHFLLTTELAQISLWVDDQGHLQLVSAPDAQYQAMRKK